MREEVAALDPFPHPTLEQNRQNLQNSSCQLHFVDEELEMGKFRHLPDITAYVAALRLEPRR